MVKDVLSKVTKLIGEDGPAERYDRPREGAHDVGGIWTDSFRTSGAVPSTRKAIFVVRYSPPRRISGWLYKCPNSHFFAVVLASCHRKMLTFISSRLC